MYSCNDTRCRVGCPIRISTDQRLLAAPRGFSQRATSFIASWCQGIHRMPFLYSICATWLQRAASTMHRNHPQTQLSGFSRQLPEATANQTTDCLRTVLEISTPHTTGFSRITPSLTAYAITASNSTKSFTTPLNPRRRPLGRCPHRQQFPVRQFSRTTHQFPGVSCQGSEPDRPAKPMHQHLPDDAPRDAPEPDSHCKEQYHPTGQYKRHDHTT
jgi:hypothetical protein